MTDCPQRETCNVFDTQKLLTNGQTRMDLLQLFHRLKTDESGAVTVDWVVLTAAIVTLGFIVMFPIGDGIALYSVSVASNISDRTPGDYTFVPD